MTTAKLFTNGSSQAVRLPKEFRFQGTEVGISEVGGLIVLFPKDKAMDIFLSSPIVSDDFCESILETRKQDLDLITERENL